MPEVGKGDGGDTRIYVEASGVSLLVASIIITDPTVENRFNLG